MISSTATSTSSVTQHRSVVLGRDVAAVARARPATNVAPVLPVGAAGDVEQHDRRGLGLARLQQREQLERLVEGAEAAGQEHERVGLLHERQLAGEEVAEVDELRVVGEELAGRRPRTAAGCSRRTRSRRPAPSMPASMIPGPAPVMTIQSSSAMRGGEVAGLVVERVVGLRAGRAEDRDLARRRGTARTRGTRSASPSARRWRS